VVLCDPRQVHEREPISILILQIEGRAAVAIEQAEALAAFVLTTCRRYW